MKVNEQYREHATSSQERNTYSQHQLSLAKSKRAFWEAVGLCFLDSSPNYSNWAVQFTQVY